MLLEKFSEMLKSQDNDFDNSLEGFKEQEVLLTKKIADLERMEDQFNQCVALVPESDEGVQRIQEQINDFNSKHDKAERERVEITKQFEGIRQSRNETLKTFISKVEKALPDIYGALSSKDGHASSGGKALIVRPDNRFDAPILLDFCPPGKSWGTELNSLSGGEKDIATLAFVFALVKVMQPPLLVMDEVDQFLDRENTSNVTNYLRTCMNEGLG